jgi:hypothetical protein
MNGKVARVEELLARGWDVEDIVSDSGSIEVRLQRGPSRMSLVLDEQDAWDILYGQGLAPEPGSARREEHLLHR